MTAIPDRLPTWMRNGDFLVVRVIAVVCFVRMVMG